MAKRAHAYPQVRVAAADLVDVTVAIAPPGARVGEALALARARDARAVLLRGRRQVVLRDDLARAGELGLADLEAGLLARPVPTVDAREGEVMVRRRLAGGAPLLLVTGEGRPIGGVAAGGPPPPIPFGRELPEEAREVLETVGRVAAGAGVRAFAVGGVVRDRLGRLPGGRPDVDVAVEGDGVALARALGRALGGSVAEHRRFLTATVTTAAGTRIDVATCRAERYEAPGALPRVLPAGIGADLQRRDFTINALALELGARGPARAWTLLDPLGGRADLGRRRLRVVHPLSFVEDPTRLIRMARYAARLGFAPDAWTARCQALAVRLGPYPALSGDRLGAEVERLLADARPEVALAALGRAGVLRLCDPRYRFTRATARAVAALGAALAWCRDRELPVAPLALAAVAIVCDQTPAVARAALPRLGFTAAALARLARAHADVPGLVARLPAAAPAARARLLADRTAVEWAALWLLGGARVRAAVDWFVTRARHVHASLGGGDVIALGVPRGPAVARALAALRDARLEGAVRDRDGERAYVEAWVRGGLAAGKEG